MKSQQKLRFGHSKSDESQKWKTEYLLDLKSNDDWKHLVGRKLKTLDRSFQILQQTKIVSLWILSATSTEVSTEVWTFWSCTSKSRLNGWDSIRMARSEALNAATTLFKFWLINSTLGVVGRILKCHKNISTLVFNTSIFYHLCELDLLRI